MKKIFALSLALLTWGLILPACSDEDKPFSTATASDDPRILDPLFPDRVNGELPVLATLNSDGTLTMRLVVTPAEHTTVTWYIDGAEVQQGTELSQQLLAGRYLLRAVVRTSEGRETYREGIVVVNPLAGEPSASETTAERIVAPGATARLTGTALEQVTGLLVGGMPASQLSYDTASGVLSYTVPQGLAEGEHRLVLVDAMGKQYGGGKVRSSTMAVLSARTVRSGRGALLTLTGLNLDQVSGLSIGKTLITEFISQSASSLSFVVPELAEGSYTLSGTTRDGRGLQFAEGLELASEATFIITAERTLWSGHHYVSWELGDGDPNKTFNLIPVSEFANLTPGATMQIYYSLKASDAYHQMRITSAHWTDLPGGAVESPSSDGVRTFVLTAAALQQIQEQGGFMCIGHGYYVDRITIK